jgi:hypothetical protein
MGSNLQIKASIRTKMLWCQPRSTTILIARNRKYRYPQPGKGGGQADNILIIFCTSGAVVHNKSSAEGKTFHMQSPVYLLIREK